MKPDYQVFLMAGLRQMQIDLTDHAIAQLCTYVELLAKWSKVYNLTTNRDFDKIVTQHILDSLSLLSDLDPSRKILDVGTGAGLPSIPLAIARPDITFIPLDSQQKKINFVQHVVTSLQLTNVLPMWSRVESLPAIAGVDMVVSRAFASLADFVNLIAKFADSKIRIVAMKGRMEQVLEEQALLPKEFKVINIKQVVVTGLDAQRCLVFLTKHED